MYAFINKNIMFIYGYDCWLRIRVILFYFKFVCLWYLVNKSMAYLLFWQAFPTGGDIFFKTSSENI